MKGNLGQSSIELLVALGIFGVLAGTLSFFILDSYTTGRLANEIMIANFLAEEGMEATRSIRDNKWDDLSVGNHGLVISADKWIFQGSWEDISDFLREGTRILTIEDIDTDRKKITCQVFWKFTEQRPQQIQLVTYLTNWQKVSGPEILRPTAFIDSAQDTINPEMGFDEANGTTWAQTSYGVAADPSIVFHAWQTTTNTYKNLTLKYRYHAATGTDDTYSIAYSTDGGTSWADLIPPTSEGVADTTVSIGLLPDQDLSQLQVKIYTQKVKGTDKQSIFTGDIWTEGIF